MKLRQIILGIVALALPLVLVSCGDDEESGPGADFASISSNYYESDGTTNVTIPLRNAGSVSGISVRFGGTATEGQDFQLIGITSAGVEIRLIDDNVYEDPETIRIQLVSEGTALGGNIFHTINIISNCEDTEGLAMSAFVGSYAATEKYGPTPASWYGPYNVTLTQDTENPNILRFNNFYDSGCNAYMLFNINAGTVSFPNQNACGMPITNSTGTFDLCNGTVLNINLNFDGGNWLYTFRKN
ncbi:MAG: hypothetical protein KF775_19205 [Cyclobacteriaceae bacterium]|nr:hypothetical protein [Cyclobacteriaceae bacterium]